MTIGQHGALKRMLGPVLNQDPVYGYPYSIQDFPREAGLFLAYEKSGYIDAGPAGRERAHQHDPHWCDQSFACSTGRQFLLERKHEIAYNFFRTRIQILREILICRKTG